MLVLVQVWRWVNRIKKPPQLRWLNILQKFELNYCLSKIKYPSKSSISKTLIVFSSIYVFLKTNLPKLILSGDIRIKVKETLEPSLFVNVSFEPTLVKMNVPPVFVCSPVTRSVSDETSVAVTVVSVITNTELSVFLQVLASGL